MDPEIERVTRSKEQARTSYNRLSRFYDLLSAVSERKYIEAGLEMLRAKEGERVLEVGFGTGRALLALAEAVGSSGEVYGIDISEGMSGIAQRKLRKKGLAERVELYIGDAARLPYQDGFFDCVFTSFTIDLIDTPEIPAVLAECTRVLKDGGRICVVSMSNRGPVGISMKAYLWAHRKLPALVDCRPIPVRGSLEESGFDIIDKKLMSMWGLPVEIINGVKPGLSGRDL
ncbi:MAG: methyltransferase domain-containing protein [Actinobacteria bacterium]|nr:methyltransferase domain-containing protein [Actinomycetota bacterium]